MKFSTAAILAAASASSIFVSATCPSGTAPFVIDFSKTADGTALSGGSTGSPGTPGSLIDINVELPCGVKCRAQRDGYDPWEQGMIFNSNCGVCVPNTAACTGNDPDLGVGRGNLLIVSDEDVPLSNPLPSTYNGPNDYAHGGDIRCYFTDATTINTITFVDIDTDSAGMTKFFSGPHDDMSANNVIGSEPMANVGEISLNNSPACSEGVDDQVMNKDDVTWFQAWSGTSFGIASIEICKPEGSSFGDPHFVTFTGDRYDYHGICDLKFVESPSNNLLVHLRTERKYHYSYISSAAIKLNEDIFEFASHGEVMVNGVMLSGDMEMPETFGGHALTVEKRNKNTHHYNVDFGDGTGLMVKCYKEMVSVSLKGPHSKFADSVGLMGDPATGRKLGRDGTTVFDDEHINDFGAEWQVQGDEPMLFDVAREPQAPEQRCLLPTEWIRGPLHGHTLEMRQLRETVPRSEAEEACAKWMVNREACIQDVIITGDKELAASFFD